MKKKLTKRQREILEDEIQVYSARASLAEEHEDFKYAQQLWAYVEENRQILLENP